MKPIGPLMREHRTIEKIIPLLDRELKYIRVTDKVNPFFILTAVDFFRTYADRTHHGKEEDLLFKGLIAKQLTPELQRTMEELLSEHLLARETVGALKSDTEAYMKGDEGVIGNILSGLQTLVNLYPKHIEKEDKHFFYPVQEYFDKQEQQAMLEAFQEFDRKMIHEKYEKSIESMKELLS